MYEEIDYSQDPQQRRPLGRCPCCGGELWERDQEYCGNCLVYIGEEYVL